MDRLVFNSCASLLPWEQQVGSQKVKTKPQRSVGARHEAARYGTMGIVKNGAMGWLFLTLAAGVVLRWSTGIMGAILATNL